LQPEKEEYILNSLLRMKYNPTGYKTKNTNWMLIQKSFGDVDRNIKNMILNQYMETGRNIFLEEWQAYQEQRIKLSKIVLFVNYINDISFLVEENSFKVYRLNGA